MNERCNLARSGKRIIKGRPLEVDFDRSHQRDSHGNLVMEAILETKAETILQFIGGLRGSLHVTFEEGTWSAWSHAWWPAIPARMPC
jgi:hypothetical protein